MSHIGPHLHFSTPGMCRYWCLPLALILLLVRGLPAFAGQAAPTPRAVAAPELTGDAWLNVTNGSKPSLAARKGKVTVLHFWTFDCINCRHNLPYYARWRERFGSRGLEIIGIHTPETDSERDPANVARKVNELGIRYPVLLDPKRENWNRWQQRWWPAIYLIDKQGRVRYAWEGELEYQGAGGDTKMTALIEALLKEKYDQDQENQGIHAGSSSSGFDGLPWQ